MKPFGLAFSTLLFLSAHSVFGEALSALELFNVGLPNIPGSLVEGTNSSTITGSGLDIGPTAEQFVFAGKPITGPFDLSVQVQSLDRIDLLAKVGLMVRQSNEVNSTFAAVVATPDLNGVQFVHRSASGASMATRGNHPVNYPQTWLRIVSDGTNVTGFAGFDGNHWNLLGSTVLEFSGPVYAGVALSSKSTNAVSARFSNLAVSSAIRADNPSLFSDRERLGPSSRNSPLVISEIMYHPAARPDARNLEFVEIYNSNPFFEDISGYRLTGDIEYVFPEGTFLQGGSFIVVAAVPDDLQAVYGLTNVFGPFQGALSNGGGTLRLNPRKDGVYLEVQYKTSGAWPTSPDGAGHSLVLARPSYGERDPMAWEASAYRGGSPGALDPIITDKLSRLKINEILASGGQTPDYIELFNQSPDEVDLGGVVLTDDAAAARYVIPSGTRIAPGGFLVFPETQTGFSLSSSGEKVFLLSPDGSRVLDATQFGTQEQGVAIGRTPNGGRDWARLQTQTPGASNSSRRKSEIVINEIMYEPISGFEDDQFVELYNRSGSAISLVNYQLSQGIKFEFPTNAMISANGYVVVAKNAARLLTNYPGLNSNIVFGNFSGSLAGSGERLVLSRTNPVVSTNKENQVVTNNFQFEISEVRYRSGGKWGKWSAGGGSSLELIDPESDPTLAMNWADSDETKKASWETVSYTGSLDGGDNAGDDLHIMLMGAGEVLLDQVEVIGQGQTNVIFNSTFESGTTGWAFQGNHEITSIETSEAIEGQNSLHLRATGRGDTGPNKIRTTVRPAVPFSSTGTIRAKARWLMGDPNVLLRFHGNALEAAARLQVPSNLGTPGAVNSRRVAQAPPAVYDVTHFPAVPAGNEIVKVFAKVSSIANTSNVVLKYRFDPSLQSTNVVMQDDGTNGDEVGGDGVYTGVIPPPGTGLVSFHIEAEAAGRTSVFPSGYPDKECLVRFGDSVYYGGLGVYRFWLTQARMQNLATRHKMSNRLLDTTFVYNNQRVVYNAGLAYAGSPYHLSSSGVDYDLEVPADDLVLGTDDFHLSWPGNGGDDSTLQREQTGYWLAQQLGLPAPNRRYVVTYVNGTRRSSALEDSQRPNGDFVKEWVPDDEDGELYKLAFRFEWSPGLSFEGQREQASLYQNFASTTENRVRNFRWNWQKRGTDQPHNYTNVFNLVDNFTTDFSKEHFSELLDLDNWVRTMAVEQLVGNWDSFGRGNGQNMFAYKPEKSGWKLMIWDLDIGLGTGDQATSDLYTYSSWQMMEMIRVPSINRMFLQALQDAADGPLLASEYTRLLDAKQAALIANGVTASAPSTIKSYLATRRNQVNTLLARYNAPFSISGGNTIRTNSNRITLSGTAPLGVRDISINGQVWPVQWISETNWSLSVVFGPGTNRMTLQGINARGNLISNAVTFANLVYTGTYIPAEQSLSFNEIMYHPGIGNQQFVELYNRSTNITYDLGGFRIAGANYMFPTATFIAPGEYLAVAKNSEQLKLTYGANLRIIGDFDGNLADDGEHLQLLGTNGNVVTEVRYDDRFPWPSAPDGSGVSLQLIDSNQEIGRPANWAASTTNSSALPWEYVQVTGTASSSRLYIYLDRAGEVFIDDLQLVSGSVAEGGPNLLKNGDFEQALASPWNVSPNLTGSIVTGEQRHSGNSSLKIVSTRGGTTVDSSIWQETSLMQGQTYTLSFWYLPTSKPTTLTLRLSGNGIRSDVNTQLLQIPTTKATPGSRNSVAGTLERFPSVWLNEISASNVSGSADAAGHHEPWIEIYNASTNPTSIGGLFLSADTNSLQQWAFPSNTIVAPKGFVVVWLDGQTNESSLAELHANFRPAAGTGMVMLVRGTTQPEVLDYLRYKNLAPDRSWGKFPDGNPVSAEAFYYVTPGGTNNASPQPVRVFINEWMSLNHSTIRDWTDNEFDDWFELYNDGDQRGNIYVAGYVYGSGGFNPLWKWDGVRWQAFGNVNSTITTVAAAGQSVFIGGYFSAVDGKPISSAAYYNGTEWLPISSSLQHPYRSYPRTITALDENTAFFAGEFRTAEPLPASFVFQWKNQAVQPLGFAISGKVMALATNISGEIFAAGEFAFADGKPASRICKWSGEQWEPIAFDTSFSGSISTLTCWRDQLVAGGNFEVGTSNRVKNIAIIQDGQWQSLGTSPNGAVFSLHPRGDSLFVGGAFVSIGGIQSRGLARWTTNGWSGYGSGVSSPDDDAWVSAIESQGDQLFISGNFDAIDGIPARYAAAFSAGHWRALGSFNAPPNALKIWRGDLIATGGFLLDGTNRVNRIARWNGSQWLPIESGLTSVYDYGLTLGEDSSGRLLVGGSFLEVDDLPAASLAAWDGTNWSSFNNGKGSGQIAIHTLLSLGGELWVGGDFSSMGGVSADNIARYKNGHWLNAHRSAPWKLQGANQMINALVTYGNSVIAGGDFNRIGGKSITNVALWDGFQWHDLGGSISGDYTSVASLLLDGDDLYVGGYYDRAGTVQANGLAKYNFQTKNWSSVANIALNGNIQALAKTGNTLYVGGNFDSAGQLTVRNIARLNLSTRAWSTLGTGLSASQDNYNYMGVTSLALAPNGDLYVGGGFDKAGSLSVKGIARFASSGGWFALGQGLASQFSFDYPEVTALALEEDGRLLVGGSFVQSAQRATNLAVWSITNSTWSKAPSGAVPFRNSIRALLPHRGSLYVGGRESSSTALGQFMVLRHDGTNWQTLGEGVKGGGRPQVNALAANGENIFLGGDFSVAGGKASSCFAQWNPQGSSEAQFPIGLTRLENKFQLSWPSGFPVQVESRTNFLSPWAAESQISDKTNSIPVLPETALDNKFYRVVLQPE